MESDFNQSSYARLLGSTMAHSDLWTVGLLSSAVQFRSALFSWACITSVLFLCVSCLLPSQKLFVRRKDFQKLVRLIDLDWLLGLALRIHEKALFKVPGLENILSAICSPKEWVKEELGLCGHLEGQHEGDLGFWGSPWKSALGSVLAMSLLLGVSLSKSFGLFLCAMVRSCTRGCNTTLNYGLRQHLCCCHWGNTSTAPAWIVLVAAQRSMICMDFSFGTSRVVIMAS